MPQLADLIDALEARYPPDTAMGWDAVGLVCGDPAIEVQHVRFAVDPTEVVVSEAIEAGAHLLVTHHPMLLTPVSAIPFTGPKGRSLSRLIRAETALYVAHTNADLASPGVNDALATVLGLIDVEPLEGGLGRRGLLETPVTLQDFVAKVASTLPATIAGVRAAGDPQGLVSVVAVCGGSGGDLLPGIGDADVFVTSDLRHHRTCDHLEAGGAAVVDIAHWAGEWPWVAQAALLLREDVPGLTVTVSTLVTDPWSLRV